jgi:hypothetical protein
MQPINILDASRTRTVSAKGLWLGVQKGVGKLVNARVTPSVAQIIGYAVIVAAIIGVVKFIGDDRYAKMTEEEFEAEAKRGSRIGGALLAVPYLADPSLSIEVLRP